MRQYLILTSTLLSILLMQLIGSYIDQAGTNHLLGDPPIVEELVKTTQSWNGAMLPAYPEGQPEITLLRITIPTGTTLAKHHHPFINAGVLISGELTVYTEDGKSNTLKAGDSIVEVVNTIHYGANEGPEPAEIIVFYAGIEGEAVTVVEK